MSWIDDNAHTMMSGEVPGPSAEPAATLSVAKHAPSLNGSKGLMRMNWRAYRKVCESWLWRVRACGVPAEVYPAGVQIVRYYCRLPLDLDNLYAAAKVPLDVLCKSGWLRDDDPDALTWLKCHQAKVDREDEERTEIHIYQT